MSSRKGDSQHRSLEEEDEEEETGSIALLPLLQKTSKVSISVNKYDVLLYVNKLLLQE